MKKFYIYALAVAMTGTGSTAFASAPEPCPESAGVAKTLKAATRADEGDWKEIGTGKYSDVVLCNEFNGFYNDPVEVVVKESTANPGIYRVENPWPDVKENKHNNFMIIDARDPEFVLVQEGILPVIADEDGECHFKSMTQMYIDIVKKSMPDASFAELLAKAKELCAENMPSIRISMTEGRIKFPQNCFGVYYPDAVTQEAIWYPTMGSYSGYLELPGATAQGDWKLLGTGKMLDGFVWTIFEKDPPKEKEVQVYENIEFPGVYYIENAFADSDSDAPLVIDASNPDWVRIPQMDTRINTEFGYLHILSVSANNYSSYEEMVEADPRYADRNITLSEGVIDIPAMSVYAFFPQYDNINVRPNEMSLRSYITIPDASGTAGIGIDENAAPRYYNLQGFRVLNPEKGQLVIERRGGKTVKRIIR